MSEGMKSLADFYEHYAHENGGITPDLISRERSSPHMGGISVETDRRLPMFGYSVEDINMLVLPMVSEKIVFSTDYIEN